MRGVSLVRLRRVSCALACLSVACSKPAPPSALAAQTTGTIAIAPLSQPVRIVRDAWGVPHIYAESQHDLFVAQGFVQAQDRLFQMDLWKKAAQGRLSQVLGSNFIERDAMTRRFQYRGDPEPEWESYGPGVRGIAEAFVSGINAWVELARARPPEPFVFAGWKPEFWTPEDLLNRTDAFLASGDALAEASRTRMSEVIADAIRRIGTAPFFVALAAPVQPPSNVGGQESLPPDVRRAPLTAAAGTAVDGRLAFADAVRSFETPSRRYLVHLHAPGWNVIGATRPWLPGVAAGHNSRIAWAPVPADADTEDIYAERTASLERVVTKDSVVVKGRKTPFVFDIERTPHGVVFASDRAHGISFTLRWSGTEPGAAAELGALALDRAESWEAFRAALARWKMPIARVLYADRDGNAGFQDAGLVPRRRGSEWVGWESLDSMPHQTGGRRAWTAGTAVGAAPPAPVVFSNVLGITPAARRRFDVGPVQAPSGHDNPVRLEIDARAWNDMRAMNAPGQAESPASPHFRDGADAWVAGKWMPLPFGDEAVRGAARETLMLVPKRPAT